MQAPVRVAVNGFRAMTGLEPDGARAMARADASLCIRRGFLPLPSAAVAVGAGSPSEADR